MVKESIYKNIDAEISRIGYNRGDLARDLGITRQTLNNIIKGKTKKVDVDFQARLRDLLNSRSDSSLTIDYLFEKTTEEG